MLVPLLLLATPQRATLHGSGHHAGAHLGRADGALARLPETWAAPVGFARLVTSTPQSNVHSNVHPQAEVPVTAVTAAPPATPPAAGGVQTHVVNVSYRRVVPTPPAPTTTVAPVPPVASPAAAPKPVTAPASTPPPAHGASGLASWYGSPAGTCASPTLAFGTVVTVTDVASGASVRCTVDDREAHNPGRVVDLAPATFSQLASLGVGVIEVRLSW